MVLEKFKTYKLILRIICVASALATLALVFVIRLGNAAFISIIFFFVGFNLISVAVVCFDLGVEQLYPLGESFSPTILNLSDAIGTLILISVCTAFLEDADFEQTGN